MDEKATNERQFRVKRQRNEIESFFFRALDIAFIRIL